MKKYILIILCCLTSFPLWSYNVNMIVEHYSVDQGLPNNTVNCTLKDRDGFIWFGTWYGLCCFDGVKFKTFNKQEHDSDVPPRKIQRIVEDKNGYIWVKTIDRKLYVFNKVTECFHAVYDDMKNYSENIQVIKLQNTAEGDVLLLTKDKNLLLAGVDEKGQVTIKILFDSRDEINKHDYTLKHHVLCETEEYISWIGTDYKVSAVHKGAELASRPADFITSKINSGDKDSFTSFFEDGRKVWVGDRAGIFYSIDVRTGLVNRYVLSEIKGAISNLLVTPAGYVYLSVAGQGTYEYDLAERRLQKINTEMNDAMVTHAFIDQYDKIWFHENEKALIYYDPLNHTAKRFPFTMFGKITTLYSEDAGERGLFFLSPAGEAWLFDREHVEMVYINKLKQLSNDRANQQFYHLMLDNDGVLWLSSADEGVYCMNFPKKQFNLLSLSPQSAGRENYATGVRALFQSKSGDIWVGTRWQSVYRMDRNGVTKHVFSTGDEHIGNVYHIMEDDKGNLWFSTKGDGLVKAVPDEKAAGGFRFKRYLHNLSDLSSISGNDVYFTYQDEKKGIWVGTLDGGLNLLCEENGEVTFKNKYNGFKNYPTYGLYMEVRNMIEDNDGRMWVGTMDGLMSFKNNFASVEQIDFETYRGSNRVNYADSDVYALYKDEFSQIWVCVFGGGLSKLSGYDEETHKLSFKSYGWEDGLNNDVVMSIIEDDNGFLWLATEKGLSCFDRATSQVRNYDKYDGFPPVVMEENTALKTLDGELWLGCKEGILTFSPDKLETQRFDYNTFIVGCQISNRDIRSYTDHPIIDRSITYTDRITLNHNQSMFTLEFAALNYNNQNRVSYKYILEGYEKEWHYNGKNRIASYTNVPPGKYLFRVQTLDEANPGLESFRELTVVILPPWWASWWAYVIYMIIAVALLLVAIKLSLFMIKVKNDVYIEQKLSELKIKFFTNISHELRTPLTLIQGPIQELREKEKLSQKGMQYVDLMEKNTKQMLQLVNQILDFRKIQNGKMRLHVSLFNLNEMVDSFEKEFRVMAEENEVSFTFQLAGEDIMVWADKEKVAIVIRNIISNAFKFTPAGGNIYVTMGVSDDDRHCYVRVEDSGVGIPQSKLSEIFERFSQADSARGAYYQGTGIGLALSKEIISLHHGEIYAESPEGKGAVFTIELQLGKEHYKPSEVDFYMGGETVSVPEAESVSASAGKESEEEKEQPVDSSLPTVLIVEDNKDLCNMLKLQLEDKFNIYMANDGVEGLKKVHLYHPDMVVTDQMMPNMDGIEMLQRIRKDFQISHIPVIILTAKGNDEAKTKAISMGANAYIIKPFSKDYLVARIEQLLNERKLFRERVWQQPEEHKEEQDTYEQFLVKKDVQFIEKIHQVIEENLDNSDFNIDTIASTIGLSRSAFFKKLKSLTGFAPVDLVKEIRLNKSIELIKNSDMSISEIAFAVGFKDSGYFSKCFRKKYDQTPREYMNEWRKG